MAIKNLAYGSTPGTEDNAHEFQTVRAFPNQRAGVQLSVNSTFKALNINTGSAIGLHQPVDMSALTNGQLDPSKSGFLQKGSNVSTFVTVAFTFNATSPTALTISWPATALRRANRTLTASSDTAIPAGSISITGLVASTTYYGYPFWSENASMLGWAGAGNATSAGSPAILQTAQSDVVLQQQSFQGFVPINTLQFTMPAMGALSQTGGYGTNFPNLTGGGRNYRILPP